MVSSILETLKEEVEAKLAEQAELLRSFLHSDGNVISRRIGLGSVVDMVRYNQDMDPDFVFMGTRGERRSAKDYLIGSNTMMVLQTVKTPVLLYLDEIKYRNVPDSIFVP